jgi:hypothetical protein
MDPRNFYGSAAASAAALGGAFLVFVDRRHLASRHPEAADGFVAKRLAVSRRGDKDEEHGDAGEHMQVHDSTSGLKNQALKLSRKNRQIISLKTHFAFDYK